MAQLAKEMSMGVDPILQVCGVCGVCCVCGLDKTMTSRSDNYILVTCFVVRYALC